MQSTPFLYLNIACHFGTAMDGIHPTDYAAVQTVDDFYRIPAFTTLRQTQHLEHLLLLRQTHSINGLIADNKNTALSLVPFGAPGDFLITSLTSIGIGVMTADCLPIIFYDPKNRVVAIAHAGWRGATCGIAAQVITTLQQHYATHVDQLHILLGPSARACCYQVGNNVIDAVAKTSYLNALRQTSSGTFFDLGHFVSLQLQGLGVLSENIVLQHNICTICNGSLCSYRRQGAAAGRQVSMVWLV